MSPRSVSGRSDVGYDDREHAGRVLAGYLPTAQLTDPVVLGLVRGGVPVAAEVARALGAPLRVCVARKIGAPGQPELAVGAVTAEGPADLDERMLRSFGLDRDGMRGSVEAERAEAQRRERRFGGGGSESLRGRHAVLVDDGLATGATARAAVRMLRAAGAARVLLAVPVGAGDAVAALRADADEVVCVLQPVAFAAVGQWYRDFGATEDAEIDRLLAEYGG